jgi:plasmid replication initiation protein
MRKKNGQVVAVMANQIARARHALSLQEQRLFLWLVSRVEPFLDQEFSEIELSVSSYASLFGRERQGCIYTEMEQVTDGLLTKLLEIQMDEGRLRRKIQWLSRADYLQGKGLILIRLHADLKPFLLALKKQFAQVPLREVFSLRSRYAISFFQMCCSWDRSDKRSWTMSVPELREWLDIKEGELTTSGNLKAWVIEQARRELDERVSLSFRPEPIRSGRKVTGWKFSVIDNKPKRGSRNAGTVDLPEDARSDWERASEERLERARIWWNEATEEERQAWVSELPGLIQEFAPRDGGVPRRFFLNALSDILEPKLPGFEV